MADILLLYPPDKKVAAGDIRGALAAAGYRVIDHQITNGGEITARVRGSGPALLVWSRGLASAAITDGWFAQLRKLPNLLELSTDGIAPQEGDESRVILLSGWRGQPFHLGWQRVLGEVKRLGATPGAPVAAAAPAGPATGSGKAAAVPAAPGTSKAEAPARKYALPAAAALALIGSLAAASWIGTRQADSAQPQLRPAPVVPVTAPSPPQASVGASAAVPAVEPSAEALPARSPVQSTGADNPARSAPDRTASVDTIVKRPTARPARASRAPSEPLVTKRYTKRGSKMMRRFCARAGRNTLECRIFQRSVATKRS